ncbi:nucleolar protein 12 [Kwoniella heveanensis CBS 569]|nr:nucleolar protein 12 [Kwoniella heveanensis CBS 569]
MGKGKSAAKGKGPEHDSTKKRKRADKDNKHAGGQKDVSASEGGFSLFSGKKESDLDDVFAKSTSFSAPASAPVASSSKLVVEPEASRPAQKRSKKEPTPLSESDDGNEDGEDNDDNESNEDEVEGDESQNISENDQDEEDFGDEGEDEDEDAELVHESLKAKAERKAKKAKTLGKYVPPGETSAGRDRRTVFVGNLPIDAAKSKSILHQFRQHLLSFVPTAKIESVRFRSVAFASATSALPTDDPEKDANQRARREKERTAAWRAQQDSEGKPRGKGKGGDEDGDTHKVFIDAKGKRKVAFIKKDFHSELASCNAYVVFAYPHPERSANVAPVMDPFEAAAAVIAAANGSTFLERTIRVDSLRLPSAVALASAGNALAKRDAWLPKGTDPKKSLFVGGLEYAAKDEDVRSFFEELVKSERGPAEDKWVVGVRIVRDNETQLGKGFGYVHFSDRESVDEILAMDASKIRFAKRTLRVQPCKTLPSATTLNNTIKSMAAGAGSSSGKGDKKSVKPNKPFVRPGAIPKGNPKLGEKIKDLSKDERKAVKSADADRQARRLAKKKARLGMDKAEKGAVKLNLTKSERERTKGAKPKAKKGKIRGPNAIAKMKGSRA